MARISLHAEATGNFYIGAVALANAEPGLATIGVKRDSDGLVVVPPETAMTVSVADPTLFLYDTTILDPLTTYTAYMRVEIRDVPNQLLDHYEFVTATIRGLYSQTTLRNLRRKLAQRLGSFSTFTTSDPGQDIFSIQARSLINRQAEADEYDNGWLYSCNGPNAGIQARVLDGSFEKDSGILSISRDFVAQQPSLVEMEWYGKLPAYTEHKYVGLRECINEALSSLWFVTREVLPEVDGIQTNLNSFDWLRRQSQIVTIENPGTTTEYPFDMAGQYWFRYDADRPMLIGPSRTEEEHAKLRMVAYRPLNTWVNRGGAWQEADGLVDDSDYCLGDWLMIREVALYHAYKALSVGPDEGATERKLWEARAEKQSYIAANIKRQNSPAAQDAVPTPHYYWHPGYKDLQAIRKI